MNQKIKATQSVPRQFLIKVSMSIKFIWEIMFGYAAVT